MNQITVTAAPSMSQSTVRLDSTRSLAPRSFLAFARCDPTRVPDRLLSQRGLLFLFLLVLYFFETMGIEGWRGSCGDGSCSTERRAPIPRINRHRSRFEIVWMESCKMLRKVGVAGCEIRLRQPIRRHVSGRVTVERRVSRTRESCQIIFDERRREMFPLSRGSINTFYFD